MTRTDESRHMKLDVELEFLQALKNRGKLTTAFSTELSLRCFC